MSSNTRKFLCEEVAPATDRETHALLPTLEKRCRPRFRAMVNPDTWTWRDDLEHYVPYVAPMVISGGVCGTAIREDGSEDDSLCRANWGAKGFRVIELGDPRFPHGGQYMLRWKCKGHGWAYSYTWERPTLVGNVAEWVHDQAGQDEFLRAIVTTGTLGPMDNALRRRAIDVAERRVERLLDRSVAVSATRGVSTRLVAAQVRLAAMEADLADAQAGQDRTLRWAFGQALPESLTAPTPKRPRKVAPPVPEVGDG